MTVTGGAGNDRVRAEGSGSILSCGLGADNLIGAEGTVTDGCAPQLKVPKKRTGSYSIREGRVVLNLGQMERAGARLKIDVRSKLVKLKDVRVARPRTIKPKGGKLQATFELTAAGIKYLKAGGGDRKELQVQIDVDDPKTRDRGETRNSRWTVSRRG
jgi:hypothetical protein